MNTTAIEPLEIKSLKAACIARLEAYILSGKFAVGERLPSERKLAQALGVSRPVLHQALVDLQSKGLLRIEPRRGVHINDYRTHGTLESLNSLLEYLEDDLDPLLMRGLMDARMLIERESARLAATQRTQEQLERLQTLYSERQNSIDLDLPAIVAYDFNFHHQVAIASWNPVFPLILNSLKSVHTTLAGRFYQRAIGTPAMDEVLAFHTQLIEHLRAREPHEAAAVMAAMLEHGERLLM